MATHAQGRSEHAGPVDVVIVGGGPIGLVLASLLRASGVGTVVLEAHAGPSKHPKARGISARSMEVFRGLGIEERIRAAALPADQIRFFRGTSLIDPAFTRSAPPATHEGGRTPSPGVLCSQDVLEPILLDAAREAGADVRFEHRATSIDQDPTGVTVGFEAPSGAGSIRARYLVGCDGAASATRRAAGIGATGETGLGRFLSIRFEADLVDAVRDRTAASYFLSGGKGGFLAVDNRTHWIYQYPVGSESDARVLAADPERMAALVRDAAGIPALEVRILDTMLWRMDARIADDYRSGRILLAGDAAHQTPPTGGHGMNVGIGDADTLSWRLAEVLRGGAAAALDEYTAERRPIAAAVVAISSGNANRAYGIDDELLLGAGVGVADPVPNRPYVPSGAVGRRLPHVELIGDPAVRSTLDLLRREPILLTAAPSPAWRRAVEAVPGLRGAVPVAIREGERRERVPGAFAAIAALADDGALLVRPDGHIAARFEGGPGEAGA